MGGNEGVAQVIDVGDGVEDLQIGDWVVMTKPQSGTWLSGKNVRQEDVLKVPKIEGLTQIHAATITVILFFLSLAASRVLLGLTSILGEPADSV